MEKTKLDHSSLVLVGSNLLTLVLAILFDWSFGVIMFAYWAESIIIGIFTALKLIMSMIKGNLLDNKAFGLLIGVFGIGFFIFHYGMFHIVYLVFLTIFSSTFEVFKLHEGAIGSIITMASIFFLSHGYSFYQNTLKKKDGEIQKNTFGAILTKPYSRIIPMHLTIIFGSFVIFWFSTTLDVQKIVLLILFIGLKTFADLKLHQKKHKLLN